ncbi:hypothetical protein [Salinicola halophyticus]|uniref:hypothetical protein n=1 Tax=Salinicola halophyticus TaxID=1808881 RepID=UPI003F47CC80
MAFRASEAADRNLEEMLDYFLYRGMSVEKREESREVLLQLVEKYGPVVDGYPSWHPLVTNHDDRNPARLPSKESGYSGLDHTRYLAHAFITCPYVDGEKVIRSVENLPLHHAASIRAEFLDIALYNADTRPVLVYCEWEKRINPDNTVPLSVAMQLLLMKEIPCSEWSQVAETWESMRPYFLGSPHGSRSSLFIDQESGQKIKTVWNQVIGTGMFGDIATRN